jgi:hypothetical protein
MQAVTLSELIAARIAAKRIEDEAIAERRAIDKALADMLKDPAKPEGSISQRTEGCKVTVTYKIDRKVDVAALTKGWDKLSTGAQAAFKWKPEVSVSELRKLEPADAAAAAVFITAKDGSPQITIEAV